jgi:TRAP-type C4-dicarboxylate transport system permease large subunit
MITALGIGFITPPMGLNLFVVSGVTGTSVLEISRYALTFVGMMLIAALLIAFIPGITLWLL